MGLAEAEAAVAYLVSISLSLSPITTDESREAGDKLSSIPRSDGEHSIVVCLTEQCVKLIAEAEADSGLSTGNAAACQCIHNCILI